MSEELNREWACGCVKRDRIGNLTHIRINDETTLQCEECGANQICRECRDYKTECTCKTEI